MSPYAKLIKADLTETLQTHTKWGTIFVLIETFAPSNSYVCVKFYQVILTVKNSASIAYLHANVKVKSVK